MLALRIRRTLPALAAIALILTMLASVPAAISQPSDDDGAGVVTGTETSAAQTAPGPPNVGIPVFCAPVTPSSGDLLYDLSGEGTYTDDSGNAIYRTGANTVSPSLDIDVFANDSTGTYFIAPDGMYTQNQCIGGNTPDANDVPVKVTVQAGSQVATSNGKACDGSGTMNRIGNIFIVDWTLDEACDVQGNVPAVGDDNGTTAPSRPHHIRADLTPCIAGPTCGGAQVKGAYWQE